MIIEINQNKPEPKPVQVMETFRERIARTNPAGVNKTEIEEVENCLAQGKIESKLMNHQRSLYMMKHLLLVAMKVMNGCSLGFLKIIKLIVKSH